MRTTPRLRTTTRFETEMSRGAGRVTRPAPFGVAASRPAPRGHGTLPRLLVLRALGLPRRKLGSIVHWQVSLAVVAVLVVAVPVGVALGTALYRSFPDQMGAITTTEVPWAAIAAASAGLVVLANLIVVVPGRMAGRATLRAD